MRHSNSELLEKIKKREALHKRIENATPVTIVCPEVDMVKVLCLPHYDIDLFELCEFTIEAFLENKYKLVDPYTYYPTLGDIKERQRLAKTSVECPSCSRPFKAENHIRLNGMVEEQKYCDRCHELTVRNGIKKYGSYEKYVERRNFEETKRKIIKFDVLKNYLGIKANDKTLQEQMIFYNEVYRCGYKKLEDFKEHIVHPYKKIEELGKPRQSVEEIEIWDKDLTPAEISTEIKTLSEAEEVCEIFEENVHDDIEIDMKLSQKSIEEVCEDTTEYISDKEFEDALVRLSEHKITFLTGKAGTGKTTFLKIVQEKYENVVVLAPTGIAALNAGGVTIHSFFQMGFRPYMPNDDDLSQKNITNIFKYSKEKQEIIRNMNLMIIDEVSMVKSYTIDVIDRLLRYYRRNSSEAFGGVQVLFIGDLLQLPPVVNSSDGERTIIDKFYDSEFFFDAKVILEHRLTYRELTKVYRQTDIHFIDLLGRIRLGKQTEFDLDRLNRRLTTETQEGFITLTNTKKKAQAINDEKLKSIESLSIYFDATIRGEFTPSEYPTQKRLELKVGAQVMIIKNRNTYVNGMIGVIKSISHNIIQVKVDNIIHNVMLDEWKKEKYIYEKGKIKTEVIGEFKQFPLVLAWAINIHKSQGLTFDKVKVDCRGAFANGQTYVALSRCRSMDGLELGSRISWSDIKVSDRVVQFLSQYTENKNDNVMEDIIDVETDENNDIFDEVNNEDNNIENEWPFVSDDMPINMYEDDNVLEENNKNFDSNNTEKESIDILKKVGRKIKLILEYRKYRGR